MGYKEDDKKDKLDCILYIYCQHFINIVQQLGQKFWKLQFHAHQIWSLFCVATYGKSYVLKVFYS